jgi:hypothetical protein
VAPGNQDPPGGGSDSVTDFAVPVPLSAERLSAADSKATKRPSAEIAGASLRSSGGAPFLPTLTSSVTLTIPPHSNSGRTLRLKGKGMPGAGGESPGDPRSRRAR